MIARESRRWTSGLSKHATREFETARAYAVREEAVGTDTDESGRKHVEKKAAKELVGVEGEQLLGIAVRVVAISKADLPAIERDDPGVADGDAMRVVGEIRQHLSRSAEWWLAVDDPLGGRGSRKKHVESDRIGEHSLR